VRDGVLQVFSNMPYTENERRDFGGRIIQTTDVLGASTSSGNAPPLDPIVRDLRQPLTLADGSQMHVFLRDGDLVGHGPGELTSLIDTLISERRETLVAQNLPPGLTVATVEGTVSVETQTQTADIPAGQTGSVSPDGNVTTSTTTGTLLGPDLPPAEPSAPVTASTDGAEPGLYAWVRTGSITLQRDATALEVSAGSAALAGQMAVRLLASVPDFLYLDSVPLPDSDSFSRVSLSTTSGGLPISSCRVQ
jgi:hypothetical protein